MNILHFFPPHIPLILVMSQYQFLLHVSHMYLINCRYGGVHWLVWCVRDNWLPSMGCSATSVSRGYGQCGASQEKDQILLHEPLWEVPRSRTKTLETPPADRQNCHYYHPGSILRHDLTAVSCVVSPFWWQCIPPISVSVLRAEQPDGCQI